MTTTTEADYPKWLFAWTHQVNFNPNCNRPFQVRLCGKGKGSIKGTPDDAVGHGDTIGQAAELALHQRVTVSLKVSGARRHFNHKDQPAPT